MKSNKKAVVVTITFLAIIIAGLSIVFSLLYINKDNQKAIPYVNPVVENRTFYMDESLPTISLSKGDTAGEISWVIGQDIIEGTKAYKWKFSPFKTKIYQELEGTIKLTFARRQNVLLSVTPVASQITYGMNLSNSSFTGGKVISQTDGSVVAGKWSWATPLKTPNASEEYQNFPAVFTPNNKLYQSRTFNIPVKVNKRDLIVTPTYDQYKYEGEEDPELTFHLIGNLIKEEPKFVGSLEREAGEDIGTYKINLGSLAIVDDEKGLFKKDNYNLVLNQKVDYEFIFKIQEEVIIYSVQICGQELKEGESVVVKTYDGSSITSPVIDCNFNGSVYITYETKFTQHSSFQNIINAGDYKITLEMAGNTSTYREKTIEYNFTIAKAKVPYSMPTEISVPYTQGMTLASIVLDNFSADYTLQWQDSKEKVSEGINEFDIVCTPKNDALNYETTTFKVKVNAFVNTPDKVVVPVVFNGNRCQAESYSGDYSVSNISGNDYKLKVKFDKNYGCLANHNIYYKYKLADGSYRTETFDYYSFVYNENYDGSKTDSDFSNNFEYLNYQEECGSASSYLDLSLDYIYINQAGVEFLRANNATLVIELNIGYTKRLMRKINVSTGYRKVELKSINEKWQAGKFGDNFLYYRTFDKSSGLCFDFSNVDTRLVKDLGVEYGHYNLYQFSKVSSFDITFYYKDTILFKSTVNSGNFVNVTYGNQFVDATGYAMDLDLEGVQEIPLGWCLDKDGNGRIYEKNDAFNGFGTDVNVYLITVEPFIVKYRYSDSPESPKIEDKLITSAKELKQAFNYDGYSWSANGNNFFVSDFKYCYDCINNGVLTLIRSITSSNSTSEKQYITSDDIIVGNWSNEYIFENTERKMYFKVNEDASFVFYSLHVNGGIIHMSGLVYESNVYERYQSYSLKVLYVNGEAKDSSMYVNLQKDVLVFDEDLQEYVYINLLNVPGYGDLRPTESDFKVINLIRKQSINDSTNSNKVILLTGDDLGANRLLLNNIFMNANALYYYKGLAELEQISIIKESITFDGITTDFYYLDFSNFDGLTEIYVLNNEIVDSGENKNITLVNAKIHLLNNTIQTIKIHNRIADEAFIYLIENYVEKNKPETYDVWKVLGFKLTANISNGEGSTLYEKYFMNDKLYELNYAKLEDLIAEVLELGVDVDIYPIIQTSSDSVASAGLVGKTYSVTYALDKGNGEYNNYLRTIWFDANGYYNCNSDNDLAYNYGRYHYDEKTKTGYFYEGVFKGEFTIKENGNIVHDGVEYTLNIE